MISIIIPTYNRRRVLYDLLDQLNEQKCEIVVVDDLSTDDTKDMLMCEFPKVKYNKGKGKGQGFAKQLGIKHASNDIVGFLDDDIRVNKDFIKNVEKAFKKGEKVVQTKLIFENKGEKDIKEDNRNTGKLKWNLFSKRKWNYGKCGKYIESCAECGIFFKKELARLFFSPKLIGDGYGESIMFSCELKLLYDITEIWFEPDSIVYHIGADKGGSVERYKKKRDNFCSKYTATIVKNMMWLNRTYGNRQYNIGKYPISLVKLYFLIAGIYLSIRKQKNCLKYFKEGFK